VSWAPSLIGTARTDRGGPGFGSLAVSAALGDADADAEMTSVPATKATAMAAADAVFLNLNPLRAVTPCQLAQEERRPDPSLNSSGAIRLFYQDLDRSVDIFHGSQASLVPGRLGGRRPLGRR
jgi:hypothetical protein